MGKRSGILDHEADFFAAPLEVLDQEIARCEMKQKIAGNSRNRKSLASRLHWLSSVRMRHPQATNEAGIS